MTWIAMTTLRFPVRRTQNLYLLIVFQQGDAEWPMVKFDVEGVALRDSAAKINC